MADEYEGVILDVTPASGEFDTDFLERLGHPVLLCHGPGGEKECPLLADDDCGLVDAAHGVIFQLDLDRPTHRAILRRYQEVLRDDLPIRAVVRPGQDRKYAELLRGVRVWTREPTAGDLDGFAAEVEAADTTRED
jgi:hypothetical protein